MSLLNEMLKDLNVNKPRSELPYSALLTQEDPSVRPSWKEYIPLVLMAASVLLFLLLFFSHRNKLAYPAIVNAPAVSQPSTTQPASTVARESTVWMPSVLVPAPRFSSRPTAENTTSPIDDFLLMRMVAVKISIKSIVA